MTIIFFSNDFYCEKLFMLSILYCHIPLTGSHLFLITLNHYGTMTPYGNIELVQHWVGKWLVALRHLAITWTNNDLS